MQNTHAILYNEHNTFTSHNRIVKMQQTPSEKWNGQIATVLRLPLFTLKQMIDNNQCNILLKTVTRCVNVHAFQHYLSTQLQAGIQTPWKRRYILQFWTVFGFSQDSVASSLSINLPPIF